LVVKDYPYAIGGTTETAALVTRTKAVVGYRLAADAGSFAFTGTAQPIKLRAGAGSFALSGLPAGSMGHRVWRVNGAMINLTGQDAKLIRTHAPLAASTGAFVVDGQPAGKFKGTSFKALTGSFVLAGQAAQRQRTYVLKADGAAVAFAGQAVGLRYVSPVFNTFEYTGTGAVRSVTGAGFKTGIVMVRSKVSYPFVVFDQLQGALNYWTPSNSTNGSNSAVPAVF